MKILVGDIGGTKTRLAVYEVGEGTYHRRAEEVYASAAHRCLEEIAQAFLAGIGTTCQRACFGIAGPVRGGRSRTTNLPWWVEAGELCRVLEIPQVALLNDLEAAAYAIGALPPESLEVLAEGDPDPTGNAALISAGTGLGQAGLAWDGHRLRPFATEGGHTSFAPTDELEVGLLRHLAQHTEHVSWERVLSGPGLVALYTFLRNQRRVPEPPWLTDALRDGDPAAAISNAALEGRCEVCHEALERFVRLYGAEAGNLALKTMATAGVFVGGGIAVKILPRLATSSFLDAFRAKGRMRPLLEAMPVSVILDDHAPLLGAARFAAQLLEPALGGAQ